MIVVIDAFRKLSLHEDSYLNGYGNEETHRGNTPSNKTQALARSMNMYIWAIDTLIRDSYTLVNNCLYEVLILKLNFQKNKVSSGKSALFEIGPFSTPHVICFNISF